MSIFVIGDQAVVFNNTKWNKTGDLPEGNNKYWQKAEVIRVHKYSGGEWLADVKFQNGIISYGHFQRAMKFPASIVKLKVRKYRAKLPDDFVFVEKVILNNNHVLKKNVYGFIAMPSHYSQFCIHRDYIHFLSNYNEKLIKRIFQRIKKWLFPDVYELHYLNVRAVQHQIDNEIKSGDKL